ncbi:Single-stranded DNA-binding protein, mitochondrial [Orchesella cincta]|uniref:Single-stranded DNA-binding protein, mitochondrial n=1 Tax=Orchesella cincta TaxID=48709 RepID=A0A1D2MLM4_ORCCI|nr:Single-stranded DNA-binding protein, mitochondrial [Orchesella cincta]
MGSRAIRGLWQFKSFSRQFQSGVSRSAEFEASATPNQPKLHGAPTRMEKTVNTVNLMGRVGGDPKRGALRSTQCRGVLQKTDWHRICVFKPYLAGLGVQVPEQGQRVYVTGRVSYGEVKDEKGTSHTTSSIIADDVIFISTTHASKPAEDDELD